jgi:hypothetical protein
LPRTLTSRVPIDISLIISPTRFQLTITGFIKAMSGVAMACKYRHFMSSFLQANCSVNYQSLGSADAQVRVEKDNALLRFIRHDDAVSCWVFTEIFQGDRVPPIWSSCYSLACKAGAHGVCGEDKCHCGDATLKDIITPCRCLRYRSQILACIRVLR